MRMTYRAVCRTAAAERARPFHIANIDTNNGRRLIGMSLMMDEGKKKGYVIMKAKLDNLISSLFDLLYLSQLSCIILLTAAAGLGLPTLLAVTIAAPSANFPSLYPAYTTSVAATFPVSLRVLDGVCHTRLVVCGAVNLHASYLPHSSPAKALSLVLVLLMFWWLLPIVSSSTLFILLHMMFSYYMYVRLATDKLTKR